MKTLYSSFWVPNSRNFDFITGITFFVTHIDLQITFVTCPLHPEPKFIFLKKLYPLGVEAEKVKKYWQILFSPWFLYLLYFIILSTHIHTDLIIKVVYRLLTWKPFRLKAQQIFWRLFYCQNKQWKAGNFSCHLSVISIHLFNVLTKRVSISLWTNRKSE